MASFVAATARLSAFGLVSALIASALSGCSSDSPIRTAFAPSEYDCPSAFLAALQEDASDDAVVAEIEATEFGFTEFADELNKGCAVVLSVPGEPDTYFGVIPAKVTTATVVTAVRGAGFQADVVDEQTGLGQYSKDLNFDEDPAGKPHGEVLDISLVSTALVPGVAQNFASNDIVIIYINLGD